MNHFGRRCLASSTLFLDGIDVREGGWEETGERMEIERASEEDDGGKSSRPSFKFPPYLSRWIGSKALPPPH